MPYRTGAPNGTRANLGLIVLQADETLEQEFRQMLGQPGVAQYVTRVPSGLSVTPTSLSQMEQDLPAAAHLFPPPVQFDAVAYCCTSGTAVIGADRVADLVAASCQTRYVTDPLTALIAQCKANNVTRLALLSPYIEMVNERLRQRLADAGIETPAFGTFGVAEEAVVARIDARSIENAAQTLMADPDLDALFISCTNLQTLAIRARIQARLRRPVFTSNHALAWHMAQLSGLSFA